MEPHILRKNILQKKSIHEVLQELNRLLYKRELALLDDEQFLDKFIEHLNKLSNGYLAYLSPDLVNCYLLDMIYKYPKLHRKVQYQFIHGISSKTTDYFLEWERTNPTLSQENNLSSPLRSLNNSYKQLFKDRHAKLD